MLTTWTGNWWALALRGAAALLLGIIAFMMPGATVAAIVILFGAYALTDGVFTIIAAVRGLRRGDRWGWMLLEGVIGIAAGVIAFAWPAIGALALIALVASWALFTGVLEILAAARLRRVMTGEWLLTLSGVLSILLAALVVFFPGTGAVVLVWWLGAYALMYGAVGLVLAIRVRRWTRLNPG